MEPKQSMSEVKYKTILMIAGLLLFGASIWIHIEENYLAYRFLRGIISVVFLGIIIGYKGWRTNLLLACFFICYGASSFLTMGYEDETLAATALLLNFIAFLFVIKALWKHASFKNLGIGLTLIFVLLILFNGYLLYEFITMLKDFTISSLQYAAMLMGAMALVASGFLALLYNHASNTKASLVFTIAIFLFVFAEVFRAIAYYDFGFGNTFVYIARFVLIIATGMLTHFSLMKKSTEEELSKGFR